MSRSLADQVYGYLAEDEDARICRDIPESACDEQPRSFSLQLLALGLTKLGDALVSARLVLAWILAALGAPAIFIALLVPLREALALLPQLFIAQVMRERPLRKHFWVLGSLGQALALLAMLPAVAWLDGAAAGAAITGLLVVFSLARGVCSVAAKDVLGKTISKTRRGRLSGAAESIAGFATLLVAALLLAEPLLPGIALGERGLFLLILGGAALLWLLAASAYAGIPEVPGATEGGGNAITEAIRSLGLLRQDPAFRAFVTARALLVATAFAIPYIVVLLQRAGSGDTTELAALLLANGLAGLLSATAWGRWSDRAAHHVMAAAAFMSLLVMLATLALDSLLPALLGESWLAALLLFLAAVSHQGARIGRKTYLVDMASSENRAQYTAVSNTVIGLLLLAGAGLGIVDALLGTTAVLWLLAAIAVLAMLRSLALPAVSD